MPKQRITENDLRGLLDCVLGESWNNKYRLEKDLLGYQLVNLSGKSVCFNRNGRYSAREMYIYLSGMHDFIDETSQE